MANKLFCLIEDAITTCTDDRAAFFRTQAQTYELVMLYSAAPAGGEWTPGTPELGKCSSWLQDTNHVHATYFTNGPVNKQADWRPTYIQAAKVAGDQVLVRGAGNVLSIAAA